MPSHTAAVHPLTPQQQWLRRRRRLTISMIRRVVIQQLLAVEIYDIIRFTLESSPCPTAWEVELISDQVHVRLSCPDEQKEVAILRPQLNSRLIVELVEASVTQVYTGGVDIAVPVLDKIEERNCLSLPNPSEFESDE